MKNNINIWEDKLREMLECEKLYKDIYIKHKEAFVLPVNSWDEFCIRIPDTLDGVQKPPSPMMSYLEEGEWFGENKKDVAIVKNARYCPPFFHYLQFIKIVYVIRGSAILFINEKQLLIKEGELCIVLPNIKNALFSCDDNDIVVNIIIKRSTFENAFYSLLSEDTSLSRHFWQMLYGNNRNKVLHYAKVGNDDITDYVIKLCEELSLGQEASNIMIKSYVLLMFGMILRLYRSAEDIIVSISDDSCRSQQIIKYMRENVAEITLPSLAKKFHLSEGYISRVIKKEVGDTFSHLLMDIRLMKSAEMLSNSDCSIEDIISAVGYTDASRFYRNFKKRFGMTPSCYRNYIKKNL